MTPQKKPVLDARVRTILKSTFYPYLVRRAVPFLHKLRLHECNLGFWHCNSRPPHCASKSAHFKPFRTGQKVIITPKASSTETSAPVMADDCLLLSCSLSGWSGTPHTLEDPGNALLSVRWWCCCCNQWRWLQHLEQTSPVIPTALHARTVFYYYYLRLPSSALGCQRAK